MYMLVPKYVYMHFSVIIFVALWNMAAFQNPKFIPFPQDPGDTINRTLPPLDETLSKKNIQSGDSIGGTADWAGGDNPLNRGKLPTIKQRSESQ